MENCDRQNYFCLNLYLLISSGIILCPATSYAQSNIVPDNTLGNESSVVTPDNSAAQELITGGAQREQNLFHSFQEFNITEGRGAYFVSPNEDIANIFSRVTGSNVSEILGTLGTTGLSQPNLFLINPNGIIFGENASLDIGGSFTATTADSIEFGEQGFFSASSPETPSLLTIQPSAFLVNQLNPGTIENNSVASADTDIAGNLDLFGLGVPDGESLSFLGGDVVINSGGIVALDGQINIAAVESGRVAIEPDNSFRLEDSVLGKDVSLTNRAGLLASGNSGGKIAIAAENINISGNSTVTTGILSNLGSTEAQAKDIELTASNIAIDNNSFIFNTVEADATGNGGDLVIDTANLTITNGGQAGVLTFGIGNAGNLTINAQSISLTNGGLLDTRTFGAGDGGNVKITTSDSITLDNSSIFSTVTNNSVGNAGSINFDVGSLSIINGGSISSSSFGQGNAESVTVKAREGIEISGTNGEFSSAIFSEVGSDAEGNAGDISLSGKFVTISEGALLTSNNSGQGFVGNINLNVAELTLVSGENTRIRADVGLTAEGQVGGGNVTVDTKQLIVENGAQVSTTTFGQGNAGNLTVNATESIELRGENDNSEGKNNRTFPGGLFAQVDLEGIGTGGNLTVNTPKLSISDGSKVQVATFGKGDAGELSINAQQIDIFNTSAFSEYTTGIFGSVESDPKTEDLPEGNGGNINIVTEQLRVIDGGNVSVTTKGFGNAGTLNITATESIEVRGVDPDFEDDASSISADVSASATGRGGDINIITGDLTISDRGEISVSSQGNGRGGDLKIQGNNLTLDNSALLNAETLTNDGGNIDLQIVDLITLGNNSNISATAGTAEAGGDGGNITIDTEFIIANAQGSNDITANAFEGAGGNIEISAESLFGIEARSTVPPNDTNDIDASSQFGLNGNIAIQTPDVDPTRGLDNLPNSLVDASRLITRNCLSGTESQLNQFVVTGRGGLPSNPNQILSGDATLSPEWLSLPDTNTKTESITPLPSLASTTASRIVEAKSWRVKADGTVILVAESNSSSFTIPWLDSQHCQP
jgi:filamentous hemagglutinin family protein